MLFPLIGARLHGWLDDLVVAFYVVGTFALGLHGTARVTAIGGALAHFLLTRFTNYPQGTIRLIPFRAHAFIELGEGVIVLGAAGLLFGQPMLARVFLALMGASQLVAFSFSDYADTAPRV